MCDVTCTTAGGNRQPRWQPTTAGDAVVTATVTALQTGYGLILNIRIASYSDVGATCLVDSVHVFAELWTMAISISVVLSHKEKSVDHLMKKSLWKETVTLKSSCSWSRNTFKAHNLIEIEKHNASKWEFSSHKAERKRCLRSFNDRLQNKLFFYLE